MSTPTPPSEGIPPAAPAPQSPAASLPSQRRRLIIISHSNLFYWWPVWALGFVLAAISFFGERMAIVPNGTTAHTRVVIEGIEGPRNVLVLPKDEKAAADYNPHLMHVSSSKNVGVTFVVVLLIIILITNIPLRGLWSFIVIMFILFFTIIFGIMDWWGRIFEVIGILDIRINFAGYLVISLVLFALWLVVFLLFDRQIYMIFEPGQMRVRQAIGDAETSYDTFGMVTTKQRSDLFRHWILGLGSGDLVVRTAGSHPVEIHMNNVLFIGRKHKEIEELLRMREMITDKPRT